MPRKEVIGLAELWLGDCREIAPTLARPAAVITDPPYGIGFDEAADAKNGKNGWRSYAGHGTGWDRSRPPADFLRWMSAAADAVVLWGGNYFADCLPPTMGWLVWDKGQSDFSLADVELAWTNKQQAARRIQFPRGAAIADGGQHPTQKPVRVMKFSIDKVRVPPGGVIFDPYMGSGSTGVAAMEMRHPFVGIEIDERYFNTACRRIEQAQRQGDMFRDAVGT